MEIVRCRCCGYLAEAEYLHQLIDKDCPNCACILLTSSQYNTRRACERLNRRTNIGYSLIKLKPRKPRKKITYIEFYDKNAIENLCACLTNLPEQMVLVGIDEAELDRNIAIYESVFQERGQNIIFNKEILSSWEPCEILPMLEKIVEKYDDCVFGITGGEESIIYALGIIKERYSKEKNIQVHRISIQDNVVHDCDMDGKTIENHTPALSVDENVAIYGGKVLYGNVDEDLTYEWEMDDTFETDLENMWDICKTYFKPWNKQIGAFKEIHENGIEKNKGLTLEASPVEDKPYYMNPNVCRELQLAGLVKVTVASDKSVTLVFKNQQVKRCLMQEGMVFEMKIYKTMRSLVNDDNQPLYNDVVNGVQIDWDGKLADEGKEYCNTKNEIDVFAMHNMIPIFVSCKNRDYVEADELYKLNTVAGRFGGKYAKKVLIIRKFASKKIEEMIVQRAKDMGIQIIYGDVIGDEEKLKARLENVWK